MLNKTDFKNMQKELAAYDSQRELLIKKSRDVLKLSKQVIYAVHRGELGQAASLIKSIEKELSALNKITTHSTFLLSEGSYKIAVQEYVEAILYFHVVKNKKLPTHTQLNVKSNHYLLGLCDLTGEIVRKAVYLAGKDHFKDVIKFKDLVDQIYGELLKFDFREQELRRKFDSIKYDLKKLEDLVLDLKLKGKL
jgi:predicted translin family RNA/ssDNA-binding protein